MTKSSRYLALFRISIRISFIFILGCFITPITAQDIKEQYDGQPALSPDGMMVAFVSNRDRERDLWLMNADGSNPINVTTPIKSVYAFFPEWSPDSHHILFQSFDLSLNNNLSDLWLVSLDDRKLQRLAIDSTIANPKWSPDGKSIAFMEIESENSTVWIMDANGGNIRKLVAGNHNRFPEWSPDGKSIAYTVTDNGEIQLALTDIETDKTRILSPNNVIEYAWAPKSNQIIYTTHNSKGLIYSDIWLLQTDTASEFKLTDEPIPLVMDLTWSPDEETILFSTICGNNTDIMMLILKQKSVVNITNCQQGKNAFPTWFPDSEHILLQSNRLGAWSIWVMSSDGKDAVDLIGTK